MNPIVPPIGPPPRSVPFSSQLVVFFGGGQNFLVCIFGGFGLLFAIGFMGNVDFSSSIYFRGPLETTSGKITSVQKTGSSEGGGKHSSGTPIMAYHYQFTQAGVTYNGESYHVGAIQQGDGTVTIEFPAGKPEHSRIQGMRCAPFTLFVCFTLIFPVVGFGIIIVNFISNRRHLWLAANGEVTQGKCVDKQWTAVKVNRKYVYKISFEFNDRNGASQRVIVRTTEPGKFEKEGSYPLLYDPARPAHAIAVDILPAATLPDERGLVNPPGLMSVLGAAAGPIAIVVFIFLGALIEHNIASK